MAAVLIPDDPRIPVTVLADAAGLAAALAPPGASAVLVEAGAGAVAMLPAGVARAEFAPVVRHRFGCACCGGRSAAAEALDALFQGRVRGQCQWFDRVVALAPGAAAQAMLAEALDADRVVRARFRRA